MSASMMQALVLDAAGAPFRQTELPQPLAGPGEVLVRIHASGVNPLDTKIRAGTASHAKHPLPAILGMDLAGIVEGVGEGVTNFHAGDEVWGMTGGVAGVQGTLAQYAAVDARLLAPKPACLSMREAAALPLAVITAWEGLLDRADVQPGQNLLVLGGAGGVGHVVVQIGRARGAAVFATDRADKAEYLASIGATPIDRNLAMEDILALHTGGRGFDLVYDTVGGPVLDIAFQAVCRFGHVVSCLGWGTHALAPLSFRAATYSGVFTLLPLLSGEGKERHGQILSEAARMVDAGHLRPRLDPRRFTFATVGDAHSILEGRGANGKLVVEIE